MYIIGGWKEEKVKDDKEVWRELGMYTVTECVDLKKL